jgi:hypothetical protein
MNKDIMTPEEMQLEVANADPRTNAYMPLSAGVESTATLLYAVKDPEIFPWCVHWYEPRYGPFADAMAFYSRKQAEYFNLPYGNDMSMLSTIGYTRQVPIIISGLSAFMSIVLGSPGKFKFKWFMMGGNAEDDMRMRLQFREYRKIMINYLSDCLDSSGVVFNAIRDVPEVRNPLDFMSKAEMLSLIMRHDPKLYSMIWSCPYPKGVLEDKGEITGYIPCGECFKCGEFKAAHKLAEDAKFRYQEGKEYFTRFHNVTDIMGRAIKSEGKK